MTDESRVATAVARLTLWRSREDLTSEERTAALEAFLGDGADDDDAAFPVLYPALDGLCVLLDGFLAGRGLTDEQVAGVLQELGRRAAEENGD